MSSNDTIAFSTLGEKDKIESLSGIREIVCGMRAFNKDAGHCGEGLIDSKSNVLYCIVFDKRKGHCTCHLILKTAIHRDFLLGVFHIICVCLCVWH